MYLHRQVKRRKLIGHMSEVNVETYTVASTQLIFEWFKLTLQQTCDPNMTFMGTVEYKY